MAANADSMGASDTDPSPETFRVLASRPDAPARVAQLAEVRGEDGPITVVADEPSALAALLSALPPDLAITGCDPSGETLTVDIAVRGSVADESEVAIELATALAAVVSEREDQRRKRQRDGDRHAHAMRSLKASSQHRIGTAAIRVVRRPRALPTFLRELRAIWKERSRPAAAALAVSEIEPRRDVPVLSILDEFSHQCFDPEVALVPADRLRWQPQLDACRLVLVESAWQGNGGRWSYALTNFDDQGSELRDLLAEARRQGVPTVLWNKEDPVAFNVFLDAARHVDVVLTTDAAVVDRYRHELGHDRVDALPFAAQPRLHNPIGRDLQSPTADRVCFAGSWRGDSYARRGDDFAILLDPAMDRGMLDIYDRYADDPAKGFPEPYRSAVLGSLPYAEMVDAYGRYAAFLNVNSVVDSPTMFSRRVFELLATGTPVISTRARGIDELLGDAVLTTSTTQETSGHLDWLRHEHEARDHHVHRGYRLVHTDHTYEQRVQQVLDVSGVSVPSPRRRVSVLCVSNRPSQLEHALDSYVRQTYADKELVFVANDAGFDADLLAEIPRRVPGAKVLQLDESASLGECLNEARRHASGDYIAKFDDDDLYGDAFLADLMLAFAYTDAAVVGKQTYYAHLEGADETILRFPGNEFAPAARVVGGTIVADRAQTDDVAFQVLPRGTDTVFLDDVRERGGLVFSADRFNFCQVRRADAKSHTWAVSDDEFRKYTDPVGRGLRRSSIFV